MSLRLPKSSISLNSSEKRNSFHSFKFAGDPIIAYFFNNSTPASEKKEKSRSSQNCTSLTKTKRSQDLIRHSTICTDHTWIKVCSQCNLRDQEKKDEPSQTQIIPKLSLDESCELFLNFKEKNAISPKLFKKISCRHCKRLEANSPRSLDNKKTPNENGTRISFGKNEVNLMRNVPQTQRDDMLNSHVDILKNIPVKIESDDESINLILELDDSLNESIQNSNYNSSNLDDLIYNIIVKQSMDLTSKILIRTFEKRRAEFDKRDFYFHKYILVSLKCPQSKRRPDIPARGSKCEHVECFDLREYLCSNFDNHTKKWMCPICSNIVKPNQIVVDSFIGLILASCNEDTIQFNENLEWSSCFSDIQYIDADYKFISFY